MLILYAIAPIIPLLAVSAIFAGPKPRLPS